MSDCGPKQPERRSAPPLSLRQACVKAGLDDGGKRCPDCPLRRLCMSERRWVVKSSRRTVH